MSLTVDNEVEIQNNIDSIRASDVSADIHSTNSTDLKNSEDNTNPIVSSTFASLVQNVEPSNSASLIQNDVEPAPFEGKYNEDRFIKINNENKTEYRYFGEMKITGEDTPIKKNMIDNIHFYFALQVWNEKTKRERILQIRQGEIFCNKWIFLTCFHEPDNSDRCSAIFINLEWFQQNKVQLHKTALLDNILLTNEGRADIMSIFNIDHLIAMPSDMGTNSLSIFNVTGILPKTMDDRFPLLKILKVVIYNSTEIIGDYALGPELNHPKQPVAASTSTIPPRTKPKGPAGGRQAENTKQSNALKQLALRNNMFGNANQNIIQASLNDNDLRLKRNVKKSIDPYQAVIDEADEAIKRKAKLAANRKRKQESKKDQTSPPLRAVNNKEPANDSAEAKEILFLKQQLNQLRNSYQSSSTPPMAQAEAVVAADDNNMKQQNRRKRNKKSPNAVEESPESQVFEESINESKEEEPVIKNEPIVNNDNNNSITVIAKTPKRKGKKADKQNALIISLLEKNNNELVQMKNRIHFLEGNNNPQPLSINRKTQLQSSQLSISTPLIDKHFPSQQFTTNSSSSNDRSNNDRSNQQRNSNDAYVSTTPHPNPTAVNPYYVQNPYFVQQQPPNNGWQVNTPQGMVMHPNGGMYVQQQGHQDINRHFFDYAMLDYFSGRR